MTTKTDAQPADAETAAAAAESAESAATDTSAEATDQTDAATAPKTTGAEAVGASDKTDKTGKADAIDEVDEDEVDEADEDARAELAAAGADAPTGPTGIGQGAAAVVATVLGFVSLSGSWLGTVVGARETLTGQLNLSTNANPGVAAQVKEGYTDGWHATAAVGGVFALIALIVGVAVLARPAFGAPGKPQAAWIKSVAWAGVSLGVIGLILAVAKYTDLIFGTPGLS
ncbi:hypothetical protein GTW43_28425 [Streptomyces sp. SID5785]|uniref:hypothetical protein n=1 Tax=Streptomyces sp. SID5785 TaxID=2690309 RepID=UPI001361D158|nr:hypothetical protein [Streptomyces sp. SID5785]MZD08973.1 hypothetical protein [Streptomyces sp. SID5785]